MYSVSRRTSPVQKTSGHFLYPIWQYPPELLSSPPENKDIIYSQTLSDMKDIYILFKTQINLCMQFSDKSGSE